MMDSAKEAAEILNGRSSPSRSFKVRLAGKPARNEGFALCIRSSDPELLITSKVYRARFSSNGLIGVTDEAGESTICPGEDFMRLDFPNEVASALGDLQKAA